MPIVDRRDFLGVLAGAAASVTGTMSAQTAAAGTGRIARPGMQLYTVRDAMAKDVDGTLARVAAIGYREVEFAGYFDKTAQEIRALLQKHNLTAPSTHVEYASLAADRWPKVLDASRTIGHDYVVIPYLDDATRKGGVDTWKKIADSFNRGAAAARQAGLRFAYHNHHFEFVPTDGRLPYDILLEECDRDLVTFEMDLCWMQVAREDPLKYFDRYPGRFPLVHVKDLARQPRRLASDTAEIPFERVFPDLADAGQGIIDWKRIFGRAEQAGIAHYFVEHDQPADAFASLQTSYRYLSALRF